MSRATLAITISLLAIGCAKSSADALYPEAANSDPRKHPYVIGAADVLRVTVWKDPNLSTEAAVGPGGTITLPLVGEVQAAGRTPADVQEELAQRLAAYVKDAVITVAVVEVNSYRFTVAGSVEHRGMFTPRYYVTVSEAIALAGGPTRYAATSDVVVIRTAAAGHPLRIPIDYDKILSGKRPDEDIVILAGDTVLVP
jgi:polysaccharide export outer membrane protein